MSYYRGNRIIHFRHKSLQGQYPQGHNCWRYVQRSTVAESLRPTQNPALPEVAPMQCIGCCNDSSLSSPQVTLCEALLMFNRICNTLFGGFRKRKLLTVLTCAQDGYCVNGSIKVVYGMCAR